MNNIPTPPSVSLFEKIKHSLHLIAKASINIGIILALLIICALSNPTALFKGDPKVSNISPVFASPAAMGSMMLQDAYLTTHPQSPLNRYVSHHLWGDINFLDTPKTSKEMATSQTKTTWTVGDDTNPMLSIDLKPIPDADHVSILINGTEVIRLRETSTEGASPMDQAINLASHLSQFMAQQGDAEAIKIEPSANESETMILAGETPILTVDRNAARRFNGKHRDLAFTWSNQIRKALGAGRYIDPVLADVGNSQFDEINHDELVSTGNIQEGGASWYGPNFHGKHTASGAIFNMNELTAAHKTLPFGTLVKVTFNRTGKSTVVRITDRGPYAHGRIIDLSKAAAKEIGLLGSGTGQVKLEILGKTDGKLIAQQQKPIAEGIKTPAMTKPIPVSDPNTGGERLDKKPASIHIETTQLKEAEKQSVQTDKIERVQKHHSFLGHPPEETIEVYQIAPKTEPDSTTSENGEPVS